MDTELVMAGAHAVQLKADDRIVGKIRAGQSFEPRTLELFVEMIRPGSTVLDIGSYSGLYALLAARAGARPIAFEPLPVNVAQIRQNMRINLIDMDLRPQAVSDRCGAARLNYNPRVHLTSGATLGRMGSNSVQVECITIDSLDLDDVSVIKIDVERHEPAVLRGALATIRRCRPMLIVEALDGDVMQQIMDLVGTTHRLAEVADVRNLILAPL